MFDDDRAAALITEITAISERMAAIVEEQRVGILHSGNQLARLDVIVTGLMRTQNQLIAAVNVLTTALLDVLLDQQQERERGRNE